MSDPKLLSRRAVNDFIRDIAPLLIFLIVVGLLIVARLVGLFDGIKKAADDARIRRLRRKGRIYNFADAIRTTRARIPTSLSQRLTDQHLVHLFEERDRLVNSSVLRRFGSSNDLEKLAQAMRPRGVVLTRHEVGEILDAEGQYLVGRNLSRPT